MNRLRAMTRSTLWTGNLILLASAVFLLRFGEGMLDGVRTNYFVDSINLSGGQVLWLEGIRELPGLAMMFIAALVMHLPLSRRAPAFVLLMGVGYALYYTVHSYTALLAVAITASLGMHGWFPLRSALGMCLTTRDRSGRVMGALSSVSALATMVGMGVLSVTARVSASLPLRTYYIFGGILIVLAALLLFRLPTSIGSTDSGQPRLLLKRRYWLYYVLTFFQGSRKQVLYTFGALVLVERYGLEVWQVSLLMLVSAGVNFTVGPFLGSLLDRFGERKTLSASYAMLALCCLGYAIVRDVWFLAGLFVAIRLLTVLGMGLGTYVNRIAPLEELTPTLSAGISINHITSVAMPIVAGILLPIIQYSGIFLGAGAIILLSIPFTLGLSVDVSPVSQVAQAGAK